MMNKICNHFRKHDLLYIFVIFVLIFILTWCIIFAGVNHSHKSLQKNRDNLVQNLYNESLNDLNYRKTMNMLPFIFIIADKAIENGKFQTVEELRSYMAYNMDMTCNMLSDESKTMFNILIPHSTIEQNHLIIKKFIESFRKRP